MAFGPIVLVWPRLLLLLAVGAAVVAVRLGDPRERRTAERSLWISLLVGVLTARSVYVLTHLADFSHEPWQALALWRPGYAPLAGLAGATGAAALFALRRVCRPRALLTPLAVVIAVWGGAHALVDALDKGTRMPLPALTLYDLSGEQRPLTDFRGRPVVLNLWASWCPPCRREMPVLADAQARHAEIDFVFVNQGEGDEAVREFLRAEGLALDNVLLDPSAAVSRSFGAMGLPVTLFFEADGRLAATHLGEITRAELSDELRRIGREAQP